MNLASSKRMKAARPGARVAPHVASVRDEGAAPCSSPSSARVLGGAGGGDATPRHDGVHEAEGVESCCYAEPEKAGFTHARVLFSIKALPE